MVELINTESAAALLGVKPATLIAWRHRRTGPSFVGIGRLIRYRPSDLLEWLERRTRTAADCK